MANHIMPIAVNISALFVDIASDLGVTRLVSGIAGAVLVVTRAELVVTASVVGKKEISSLKLLSC